MTTIFYGFTHETEHGNILRIERYQDKDASVPFWRIICNGRILRSWLHNRPRKATIEKWAEIADANFGHKK